MAYVQPHVGYVHLYGFCGSQICTFIFLLCSSSNCFHTTPTHISGHILHATGMGDRENCWLGTWLYFFVRCCSWMIMSWVTSFGAKVADDHCTSVNQSTAGRIDLRVFVNCLQVRGKHAVVTSCKQLTKTLGSKRPAVDWLTVVYCSSVNVATSINTTMSLYSITTLGVWWCNSIMTHPDFLSLCDSAQIVS